MFSCEFCEISNNKFIKEHLRKTASEPKEEYYVEKLHKKHWSKSRGGFYGILFADNKVFPI